MSQIVFITGASSGIGQALARQYAAQGATLVADGREHPLHHEGAGFFLGASLIDHVEVGMDCYRDEIFGPVLTVMRVETYEEAVGVINANPYGNGTAIFTRDGGAARQFQFEVNAGMVGINVPIPVPAMLVWVACTKRLSLTTSPKFQPSP